MGSAVCAKCGDIFELQANRAGRPRRFCGPDCHDKYWDTVKRNRSREGNLLSVLIGRPVGNLGTFRFARTLRALPPIRACSTCREAFLADGDTRSRFCSKRCCEAFHSFHKNALRRSAEASGDVFSPDDVFERDSWMCGLCGETIDRSLKHPHKMSATIDHIIPLSRGGRHTLSNVQAAHKSCNSRKRDRIARTYTQADGAEGNYRQPRNSTVEQARA
jgi:hypothetical protein